MVPINADRNLLFGLLALQNNFIDRDALLDAFSRWVHDRTVPLGQILRDRGALKPDEHDLLQALVAKHLEKFGDDPENSLRHISSIGSVRQDLSRIADADLQASLAHVAAACSDDPHRTLSQVSLGESTSIGSRFRVLRPYARGGLGQVSVALDQELDRPVALKEIQDHRAGHDASGRPFYAMRFIQGDSLKEAIAVFHSDGALKRDAGAWNLRLRELLQRFTDVCNAVAYAHSRGVLHRDLKPGNILLGPYGETLLVDWGLAKLMGQAMSAGFAASGISSPTEGPIRLSGLGSTHTETIAGAMVGTPAYASPEQVAGRLDLLGPPTDVYGLGGTLYALLTGRAPVESNELEEVLRRVQRGEIPPPRSLDSTIPRPLEAICQKAMALRPEDRYATPKGLAEDVNRWLADESVSCFEDPWSERLRRWSRKNPTKSLTTMIVLLYVITAILIAIIASLILYGNLKYDNVLTSVKEIFMFFAVLPLIPLAIILWLASWGGGRIGAEFQVVAPLFERCTLTLGVIGVIGATFTSLIAMALTMLEQLKAGIN
jgi:serine/threonine-protein kinase